MEENDSTQLSESEIKSTQDTQQTTTTEPIYSAVGLATGGTEIRETTAAKSQEPTDLAFQISKMLINWILGITSGFLLLSFALFFLLCTNDKKEYLDLIKILIPVITFLLGVISTLGFVNYKIPDSAKK